MDEFGVFKGIPLMKPFQLGVVADLQRAIDLMNRMNERIPGNYFVRHMETHEVLASLRCEAEDTASANTPCGPAKEPPFDIFCGSPDKNASWYETVKGLANARARMEQIARVRPGSYFVFSRRDHSILARIETFPDADATLASNPAA